MRYCLYRPDVPTDDAGKSDLTGIRRLIGAVAKVVAPNSIMVIFVRCRRALLAAFTFFFRQSGSTTRLKLSCLVAPLSAQCSRSDTSSVVPPPTNRLMRGFRFCSAPFLCPILPMRYESAELAKISINMCLVASVTVANTLAELCENIGGGTGQK